jgi:hypothetical protein
MELAALASFAILVIAWIIAPDRPRTAVALDTVAAEAQPIAA